MPLSDLRRPSPRASRRRPVPLLLGLALGVACGQAPSGPEPYEDIARRSCAARFACECDEQVYVDEEECAEVISVDLAALTAKAEAAGLTVDWTCIERGQVALHHGCATSNEIDAVERDVCEVCRPAHGDVDVGELCVDFWGVNNCKQGLLCQDTVEGKRCVDPCNPTEGSFCDFWFQCGDSMYCHETRCVPRIPVGEPCDNFYTCVEGAYCSAENTCAPLAGPGEFCYRDDMCLGDAYCSDTRVCVAQAHLGEPCDGNNACADDLRCESVCVARSGVGGPCKYGCVEPLGCDPETDLCAVGEPATCFEGL